MHSHLPNAFRVGSRWSNNRKNVTCETNAAERRKQIMIGRWLNRSKYIYIYSFIFRTLPRSIVRNKVLVYLLLFTSMIVYTLFFSILLRSVTAQNRTTILVCTMHMARRALIYLKNLHCFTMLLISLSRRFRLTKSVSVSRQPNVHSNKEIQSSESILYYILVSLLSAFDSHYRKQQKRLKPRYLGGIPTGIVIISSLSWSTRTINHEIIKDNIPIFVFCLYRWHSCCFRMHGIAPIISSYIFLAHAIYQFGW